MDVFTSHMNDLCSVVQCNLKTEGCVTRPNAGSGVWLSLLLPTAVMLGAFTSPGAPIHYRITGVFTIGLFMTSMLCIYTLTKTKPFSTCNKILFIPVIFTIVSLFSFLNCNIILSIFGGLLVGYPYLYGVTNVLRTCPKCVTFGEAAVLVQTIILFVLSTTLQLSERWFDTPAVCMDIASTILQIGLLGIGFICGLVYKFPTLRSTMSFYGVSAAIIGCFIILLLHVILEQSPVLWILQFLFVDSVQRIGLMMYWFLCTGIAFWAVAMQIQGMLKASTIVRKYLHVLAVAVYIPGLIQDCCLLYLASGIILALFIVLEMFRLLSMPPIGKTLQTGFMVYADEKDQGGLSLTPIYLLAGCSLPLWLHPTADSSRHLLPLLSGVLSIGVGDTAASVCGTWFGKHRWPGGTRKTMEGTLACILSQLFVVYVLFLFGYIDSNITLIIRSVIAIVVTSLVEAKTDQVDNLALPLVMYILLV